MNQQQQVIQRLHTRVAQVQNHLDKHLLKLQQIQSQSTPGNQNYQSYYHYAQVPYKNNQAKLQNNTNNKSMTKEQNKKQIRKQQDEIISQQELKFLKIQIQKIVRQYERQLYDKQDLSYRYSILRQSRKQLYQQVNNLKKELQKNKQKISQHKKKNKLLDKLQDQYKLQVVSVNKLQLALNNALKLQYDMNEKIKQLQDKQYVIMGKIDKQKQQEMQTSGYWKYYQKWTKLMEKKNYLCKQVQDHHGDSNQSYVKKMEQRQKMQHKLKNLQQVYNQLNISVSQQQYIIAQIMYREKISGRQLYNQAKAQNENIFGDQQAQMSQQRIHKQINSFKNQIQLKQIKPQITKKFKTEPILESNKKKVTFNTQVQNIMRLTTKIPQSQLRNREKSHSQKKKNHYVQKRYSIQHSKQTTQQTFDDEKTSLPKIKSKQQSEVQLSKPSFLVPITHMNKSSRLKRASFDVGQPVQNSKYGSFGKLMLGQSDRFQQLRKNVRYRTKNGYKYYRKPKPSSDSGDKQSYRRSNTDQNQIQKYMDQQNQNRQREDIAKVYDRISNRKKYQKQQCVCDQSVVSIQVDSKQDVESQPGHIKLKLPNERKKGKSSSKQQIQSRQSDAQNDDLSQRSIFSSSTLKPQVKYRKKSSSISSQKPGVQQQQPQYQRRRLNTIHQKEQQTNLGNSTRNN